MGEHRGFRAHGLEVKDSWVAALPLLLSSYVTLGKSLNFSESQISNTPYNSDRNIPYHNIA